MTPTAELVKELREQLDNINQAFLEFNHARTQGPWWYSGGERRLHDQVRMWIDRGIAAHKKATDALDGLLKEPPK